MGQWVQFRTQWGTHRGIISDVNQNAVLIRVPRGYAPMALAGHHQGDNAPDEEKLDLTLAQWGYGGYGRGYAPYGAYGRRGWGSAGYGGWYGGWWWWWLAFAWIFWLAFLW